MSKNVKLSYLNKEDVAKRFAKKIGKNKRFATRYIDNFLSEISMLLVDGYNIEFQGFGKFFTKIAGYKVNPLMKNKGRVQDFSYVKVCFKSFFNLKEKNE